MRSKWHARRPNKLSATSDCSRLAVTRLGSRKETLQAVRRCAKTTPKATQHKDLRRDHCPGVLGRCLLYTQPIYFFPHFVSRISPSVPPEIVSPSTGLPRKMILVSSLYPFGPNRFQALHGASIRHSLKVLAVQVKGLSASSAKQGTVAPSNNTHAINTVECRVITTSQFNSFQKITNVGPSNGSTAMHAPHIETAWIK